MEHITSTMVNNPDQITHIARRLARREVAVAHARGSGVAGEHFGNEEISEEANAVRVAGKDICQKGIRSMLERAVQEVDGAVQNTESE
jgi:hypothetical protein